MGRPRKPVENTGRIYVARESCRVAHPDGHAWAVVVGETVREGHWILEGREHLFKLQVPRYEVEQATAGPGEKRGG